VSDKAQRTIRIKWVRSGIGFTYHQKRIVRSLGLKKLNQEVERPDTPQIRGLVAKVPHLVKIVEAASKPAWSAVPEYTIYAPQAVAPKLAETAPETPAKETERTEAAARGEVTGAPVAAADKQQPVGAPTAAEAATETPGDLAATEIPVSAGASAGESAKAGEEAGSGEGQPKA
jgi:large subunit ribosomal protein L30